MKDTGAERLHVLRKYNDIGIGESGKESVLAMYPILESIFAPMLLHYIKYLLKLKGSMFER